MLNKFHITEIIDYNVVILSLNFFFKILFKCKFIQIYHVFRSFFFVKINKNYVDDFFQCKFLVEFFLTLSF